MNPTTHQECKASLPPFREDLQLLTGAPAADGSPTWVLVDPVRMRSTKMPGRLLSTCLQSGSDPLVPSSKESYLLTDSLAANHALGGNGQDRKTLPSWANSLRQARAAMLLGDLRIAEDLVHKALLAEPTPALVAAVHLQIAVRLGIPAHGLQALAEHYHQLFPSSLVPMLVLASVLLEGGESEKGVILLHQASAQDVTGQVVSRLWGSDRPYRDLWPVRLEAPLELSLPAEVAAALGWNSLPAAVEPSTIPTLPIQEDPTQTFSQKPISDEFTADTVPILVGGITPAPIHFLSIEPMLGPINIEKYLTCEWYAGPMIEPTPGSIGCKPMPAARLRPPLSWVIVGGESGANYRPIQLSWIESIVEQCRTANVPVLVKQDAGLYPGRQGSIPDELYIQEFPVVEVKT